MDIFPSLILSLSASVVLIALDLFIVLRYTVLAKRAFPRWVDFLPALALVAMVATVVTGMMFTIFSIILSTPIYIATLALFVATLVRVFKRKRLVPAARFRMAKAAGALLCAALVLLSALRLVDLTAFVMPIAPLIAALTQVPGEADLSDRSWSQAFAGLVAKLKIEYPFTAHKRLDWDALAAEFAPRIADAEARRDTKAYYHALREFAWRIHDAHIGIEGDDQGLAQAEVGGGYGLTLLPLDDGRLVVSGLGADGTAARAGIQIGAEIVAWNGTPARQALAQVSTIWSEYPPATTEGQRLQQARFLSRGPVGSQVAVAFSNRAETATRTATLSAVAAEITETSGPGLPDLIRAPVHSWLLPSGYGYIRIDHELPAPLGFPDALVQQAVARFAADNVPGIIVDVRNNLGGESGLTVGILAPFFAQGRLFHYLGMLDPATKVFRPITSVPLLIEPAQSPYQGRVAVLIDNYSHSSAEDAALFLKGLPNGMAVGMSGTAGGGGVSETDVHLPGDYTFAFPKAQSLDSNFKIQIECDDTGNGGVTPTVRVPLDDAAVDALGTGRDIVLERAVAALREQAAAR